MERLSSEELRKMVRDALREALPSLKAQAAPADSSSFLSRLRATLAGNRRMDVTIAADADLTSFAKDVARACEHADLKAALISGQISFALKRGDRAAATAPRSTHHLDKGVLTEALVIELGKTYGRLVLGKSVAITPLARDRAREAKLEIVRDKP